MKERMKTILCIGLIIVALPVVVTMVFQGETVLPDTAGTEQIEVSSEQPDEQQMRTAFAAILAEEIPITYEPEAIKAQAVIVRTNYLYALSRGEEPESGLDISGQMKLFGKENYTECIQEIERCIAATGDEVLYYRNQLVEAPFFAVSAGKTRAAAEAMEQDGRAYLASIDSAQDITSKDFLKVVFYAPQDFVTQCSQAFPEAGLTIENLMSQLEVIQKEESGYVKRIRLGNAELTGEEVRNALGLNSAYFSIKEIDGQIRIVTKGLGHGLGLSMYGANELAKEGMDYKEILQYYYSDIQIKENE